MELPEIIGIGVRYGLLIGGLAFLVGYGISVCIDFFRGL